MLARQSNLSVDDSVNAEPCAHELPDETDARQYCRGCQMRYHVTDGPADAQRRSLPARGVQRCEVVNECRPLSVHVTPDEGSASHIASKSPGATTRPAKGTQLSPLETCARRRVLGHRRLLIRSGVCSDQPVDPMAATVVDDAIARVQCQPI